MYNDLLFVYMLIDGILKMWTAIFPIFGTVIIKQHATLPFAIFCVIVSYRNFVLKIQFDCHATVLYDKYQNEKSNTKLKMIDLVNDYSKEGITSRLKLQHFHNNLLIFQTGNHIPCNQTCMSFIMIENLNILLLLNYYISDN